MSTSTVRARVPGEGTPMMVSPDGIFRIPNIRKVPRSAGTSSNTSEHSYTRPSNMRMF